jgi:GT2 family glycosyltransferase
MEQMVLIEGLSRPLIYVIILNWNGGLDTVRCLRSLALSTQPLHPVLVDNGSTDGSVAQLRAEFPDLDILENGENLGFAGGNNVGIRHALACGAEYVLLLNNDTVVDADFARPLLRAMENDPTLAAVNPKIYFLHDPQRLWAAGGQIRFQTASSGNRGRGQKDTGQFDQPETVDFGTGCCLLVRRAALQQVGLLDASFFAYYEDLDWACRAKAQGYTIGYVPDAKIWHAVGAASKDEAGRQGAHVHYLAARNQLWTLRTYAGRARWLAYPAYFGRRVLFYSSVFIVLRRWEKLKALWRGFVAGLQTSPQGDHAPIDRQMQNGFA